MSGCWTIDRTHFQFPFLFELSAVIVFASQRPLLEAATHETDPSNYQTMWDHCMTRFGKECDDGYEEFVRFGYFESIDEASCDTDAQNLTLRLGHYVFVDLTSRKLRLCAQVSSREFVERVASLSTHWCGHESWPLLWTGDSREGSSKVWWLLAFLHYKITRSAQALISNDLLGEQQFVDCDNMDCGRSGGLMGGSALAFLRKRRHLHMEDPNTAKRWPVFVVKLHGGSPS